MFQHSRRISYNQFNFPFSRRFAYRANKKMKSLPFSVARRFHFAIVVYCDCKIVEIKERQTPYYTTKICIIKMKRAKNWNSCVECKWNNIVYSINNILRFISHCNRQLWLQNGFSFQFLLLIRLYVCSCCLASLLIEIPIKLIAITLRMRQFTRYVIHVNCHYVLLPDLTSFSHSLIL